MMKFVNVTEKTFPKVYEKMKAAFPYEERRDYIDQLECLKNDCFNFFELYDDNEAVGFISVWKYKDFIFLEHLAVDEDKRSGGYGSKAIELLKITYNLPVILEAEAPVTEQQIKRIKFYDRLGFKVNDFYYEQPSYHSGNGVPLKVLSFPDLLTDAQFDHFLTETRNSAYSQKKF